MKRRRYPDTRRGRCVIDTDYEACADNKKAASGASAFDIHNPVFAISGVFIIAFCFLHARLARHSGALFTAGCFVSDKGL